MMEPITLSGLLRRCAAKYPRKQGYVSEEGEATFAQWNQAADRRAMALRDMGVRPGDNVGTLFLNGRAVLETYPALWKLGAVPVPLNVRHTPGEMAYVLENSQAAWVIYDGRLEKAAEALQKAAPAGLGWASCGGSLAQDLDKLAAEASAEDPRQDHSDRQLACILYTAGTTGRPKGVPLSHYNCLWAAVSLSQDGSFEHDFRALLVFPLYHAAAFTLLTSSLYLGCTLVSLATFDPRKVMETTQAQRLNKLAFPPTVWNMILQLPDLHEFDTSSVMSITSGAEAMPQETKNRLMELFPNAELGETYGMTETAAAISTLAPKYVRRKQACVGRAVTNVELRVVDPQGNDVAEEQVGEVIVRGPNIMEGYYRDPGQSAKVLKDGWLHTGDLGKLDDEGFLYLVDRKSDMIISGGENIYPREIEEVLYTHPDIVEAAVVGLPDPVWGQRVHAVICARPGSGLTEEEVLQYCTGRMAGYKKPRSMEFSESLPRSAAGKVLRRMIVNERTERPQHENAQA